MIKRLAAIALISITLFSCTATRIIHSDGMSETIVEFDDSLLWYPLVFMHIVRDLTD